MHTLSIMSDDIKNDLPKRSLLARLRGYFMAGVLVTAPITITAWLTITIINFVDNRVERLIPQHYNPETYLPVSLPGLGLIAVVLFLVMVGMFATNFLGLFFVRIGEGILDRLPVVRSLYGATKQIFETVFANQSEAFREVVMVEYPRKGMWVIGFLTGRSKGEVQDKTDGDTVNIFVPTTPNPTSGFLLFVPAKDVTKLNMSVEEGIKLVVSAGIVTPDTVEKLKDK
jgi:uncharacterized membrane protein